MLIVNMGLSGLQLIKLGKLEALFTKMDAQQNISFQLLFKFDELRIGSNWYSQSTD